MIYLMIKTMLPLEWYPDAQVGDIIKLTKRDIELTQTCVEHMDLSEFGDLYVVVEYIFGDGFIGAVCQDAGLEIKTGCFDPRDY